MNGFSSDSLAVNIKVGKIKQYIQSNNDSANVMLEAFRKETTKSNLYAQSQYHFLKGYLLQKKGKFAEAITEFNTFIKLQNDSTNRESIDQINRIAISYKNLTEFDNAKKYYLIAAQLGNRSNYNKGIGDSYSGMGHIFENTGKYKEAMEYHTQSNREFKIARDSLGIASSYSNIGNVMYYLSDFDQALMYYKKSAHIHVLMNDEQFVATSYGNIGMIYQQLNRLDSALIYNLKSLHYFEKLNSPFYLGTIYNNIALVYDDLKDYKKALDYHLKSLAIKEEIKDRSGLATSLINIGNLKMKLKDYSGAIDDYKKGMVICDEIETPNLKMNAYKGLSKAYQETGRYKEALDYYISYSEISDSLNTVEYKNNAARLETEFDTKQKEETIAQQKKDYKRDMAVEKAKSQVQYIILVSVILLLLIVIIFFIIFYQKLKLSRKQKAIIEKQNNENKVLLGEIHHRVKNNLQVISSLLSLQEKSITDESAKRAISEGKERVKSMGLIHKMLYQNDNFSGIEMNDYTVKLIDGLMDSFGVNQSLIEVNTSLDRVKLDVDTAIPIGLIINELVINAFKYAYTNIESPKLTVKLEQKPEGLVLQIKDNGKGNPDEINNSVSFGSKLVKSLIRQLNGELTLIYEDGLNYSILIKDYKLV